MRNTNDTFKKKGEAISRLNIGLFRLSLIAIFVGVATGFGALGFRGLIGFIHNLFFLGRISYVYDANTHTPGSPWGFFVILVPMVGGLIVTLLVTKFAPEARGHGVPEVMDAIYYSEVRIRPVVAAVGSDWPCSDAPQQPVPRASELMSAAQLFGRRFERTRRKSPAVHNLEHAFARNRGCANSSGTNA
jgi:hypothetical protein